MGRKRSRCSTTLGLPLGLLLAWTLGATPGGAHPRPFGHRHERPLEAVIVLSAPRPARRAAAVEGAPRGVLDLNVKPRSTEVWINGLRRGTCDRFDGFPGKLHLPAGLHDVRLVLPDGTAVDRQIRVRSGVEFDVRLDLR